MLHTPITAADSYLEPSAYSERAFLETLRLEARGSELHWREVAAAAEARSTLVGSELARGYLADVAVFRAIAGACSNLLDILDGHDLDMAECISELDACLREERGLLLSRVKMGRAA